MQKDASPNGMSQGFPASTRVYRTDGEVRVPFRRIALAAGEPPVEIYDTSGPSSVAPGHGLPKLRQPWLERRAARSDGNLSQMHYARRGEITEEMRFVALRESVSPEFVRDEVGGRPRHHPGQSQPSRGRADDHRPQLPGEGERQHRQLGGQLDRSTRRSRSCAGRSSGAPTR